MGNYLRKYEVEKKDDFDATPKKSERFTCDDNDLTMDEFSDPRSPNNEIFRTPLSTIGKQTQVQITKNADLTNFNFKISPSAVIKERLMEKLGCDLRDPRSPNVYINRTPMSLSNAISKTEVVVDVSNASVEFLELNESNIIDKIQPRALDDDLDDTVENSIKCIDVEDIAEVDVSAPEEILETEINTIDTTPVLKSYVLNPVDPRSPSIGIQRTPLLLDGSEESPEVTTIVTEPDVTDENTNIQIKITPKIHKEVRKTETIYEDTENIKYSTPKKLLQLVADGKEMKERTPLSCVGNRSHLLKFASHNAKMNGTDKQITPTFNNVNNEMFITQQRSLSAKSKIPVFKTK